MKHNWSVKVCKLEICDGPYIGVVKLELFQIIGNLIVTRSQRSNEIHSLLI